MECNTTINNATTFCCQVLLDHHLCSASSASFPISAVKLIIFHGLSNCALGTRHKVITWFFLCVFFNARNMKVVEAKTNAKILKFWEHEILAYWAFLFFSCQCLLHHSYSPCMHIAYERIRQWPVTDYVGWPLVNESSRNTIKRIVPKIWTTTPILYFSTQGTEV